MERGSQVWQHKSLPGERHFPAFTFQLLLTWSVCFMHLKFVGKLEHFTTAPRAGRAAQCPLLEEEEEAGWSLDSPFLSGFRSWAAAHLCLAQHWALSVPLISWKSSELQLFCHFAMMEEALGILVVVCPGTVVHLGVPGAPAQSCVCRWGRADAAPWAHAAFSLAFPE